MGREEFLDRVLSASLCGIYVYDLEAGRNAYINERYTRLTGWSLPDLNAMTKDEFGSLFHEEDRAAVLAHIDQVATAPSDAPIEIEYRFKTKDGRWIWCLSRDAAFDRGGDGTIKTFIGTFVDITDRKELEESQRTHSLGALAGGLAHDFNNILMSIMGNVDMSLAFIGDDRHERGLIEDIGQSAERAATMCQLMLAFAGRRTVSSRDHDLTCLIRDMRPMLIACVPHKSSLSFELPPKLPAVDTDAGQLLQGIMGLVVNASEALPDEGGAIVVSAGSDPAGVWIATKPGEGASFRLTFPIAA